MFTKLTDKNIIGQPSGIGKFLFDFTENAYTKTRYRKRAWQIFDQKVTHLLRDEYRTKQVTKVVANTLEELVKKMEYVDVNGFLREIELNQYAGRTAL